MNSSVISFFSIVIAVISIQFGAAYAKLLFPQIGPMGITLLRLSLASGMLWLVWRPWRARLSLADLRAVVLYGLTLGFMNLLFYLAIARIPLGLAVALEFLGPLTLAVVGSRRKVDFFWALLAAAGIFLISPITDTSNVDVIGVFFALLAAVCWALYIIFGQRVARTVHEGIAASLGMAIGALVIVPIVMLSNNHVAITTSILPQAFIVALFSSAIPYSLEMFALKRLSKLSFGVLMSLEPAMAGLIGLLMLNEQLSIVHIIAIVFIMTASLGTTLSKSTKPKASYA